MKIRIHYQGIVLGILFFLNGAAAQATEKPNAAKIEDLTGLRGVMNEKEGVFKVSFPRKDLEIKVAGARITPPMGLTAWAAFTKMGKHAMVMGDLVLAEDQVNPVMSTALDNGLEVTALHNHFLWDSPTVKFMHVSGVGDEETLAAAVGKVFTEIKETMDGKGGIPMSNVDPAKTTLNPQKIESVLGFKGELKDGVYKISVGKKTTMMGQVAGEAMGVNTWAAFAGADEDAVVDGDFAMYENELQDVLRALRHAGLDVTAIHNHMVLESPRVIFLHFWGTGPTTKLAKGLKAALETQRK